MTRIVDFLPQYESEIEFLRRDSVITVVPPHDFVLDGRPGRTPELHLSGPDYRLLIWILSNWANHVEKLAEEEVIKGNEENEIFILAFLKECSKSADFSLLDLKGLPSNNPLVMIAKGLKRARGLKIQSR